MSKGEETRRAILTDALAEASVRGLDGLTIGALAKRMGMSKSGVFAHFDSKETLQLQVLEQARERFIQAVVAPALRAPRGEPRLRAFFENWVSWAQSPELPGGCPLIAAAAELDDQPGRVKDRLVAIERDWLDTLAGAVRIAMQEGHLAPDLDVDQLVYELRSIVLGYHWYLRLLGRDDAMARMQRAFDAMLDRARAR